MANHGIPLQWCHDERDGISNYRRLDCLLNLLFRRRWKKISKLRVTGFVKGIHRWPMDSPHNGPVTRKMFPIDDVTMHVPWLVKASARSQSVDSSNIRSFQNKENSCTFNCHFATYDTPEFGVPWRTPLDKSSTPSKIFLESVGDVSVELVTSDARPWNLCSGGFYGTKCSPLLPFIEFVVTRFHENCRRAQEPGAGISCSIPCKSVGCNTYPCITCKNLNSLTPGRCNTNIQNINLKWYFCLIVCISCEITLGWVPKIPSQHGFR